MFSLFYVFFLLSTGGMGPGINGMAGSPGPGNPYGLQVKIMFNYS